MFWLKILKNYYTIIYLLKQLLLVRKNYNFFNKNLLVIVII